MTFGFFFPFFPLTQTGNDRTTRIIEYCLYSEGEISSHYDGRWLEHILVFGSVVQAMIINWKRVVFVCMSPLFRIAKARTVRFIIFFRKFGTAQFVCCQMSGFHFPTNPALQFLQKLKLLSDCDVCRTVPQKICLLASPLLVAESMVLAFLFPR